MGEDFTEHMASQLECKSPTSRHILGQRQNSHGGEGERPTPGSRLSVKGRARGAFGKAGRSPIAAGHGCQVVEIYLYSEGRQYNGHDQT